MNRLRSLVASALFAIVGLGASAAAQPLVLTHANVIDGVSEQPLMDHAVVVRDGRIEAIVPAGESPEDGRVVDLRGKYLLPGLIDSHVHIASLPQATKALRTGITTVRSMGVSHYADVGLRELRRKGVFVAPEILAAGYHVRPAPSPELFLDEPSLSDLWSGVRGASAYRRVVAANLERGVDWIKITSTERAGLPDTDPRKQTMTEVEIAAIVTEAEGRGVPVASHAHGDEGGRAAVLGGVRSIEHGTYLSEETLRLMKERGTFLVPQAYLNEFELAPDTPPATVAKNEYLKPLVVNSFKLASDAKLKMAFGSDNGVFPHKDTGKEFAALVRNGISELDALRMATINAAELLGVEDRAELSKGKRADIIAVSGNPLDDIATMESVAFVMKQGVVLKQINK